MPDSWLDKEILPEATATPMTELPPNAPTSDRMSGALASLYNTLIPRTPNDMVMEAALGALGGGAIKGFGAARKAWKNMSGPMEGRREFFGQATSPALAALGGGAVVRKADESSDLAAKLRELQDTMRAYNSFPAPNASIRPNEEHYKLINDYNRLQDEIADNAGGWVEDSYGQIMPKAVHDAGRRSYTWDMPGSRSMAYRNPPFRQDDDSFELFKKVNDLDAPPEFRREFGVDGRYPHEIIVDSIKDRLLK